MFSRFWVLQEKANKSATNEVWTTQSEQPIQKLIMQK